jgi:hypothetical protein
MCKISRSAANRHARMDDDEPAGRAAILLLHSEVSKI